MRSLVLPLVAALAILPANVLAQTIPPAPPQVNGATAPGIPICYTSPTDVVNCPGGGGVVGEPGVSQYYIPTSALAYASTTNALAAIQRKAEHVVSGGVAMSAALDMISPGDGRTNRIGGGISTFNDQAGLALVYTRQADGWDAGVGLATSRYQNMAKATIGFSW
jgi:hypothetical protein